MRIYGWLPEAYGSWAYVLAESPRQAAKFLEKSKDDVPKDRWNYTYHCNTIEDFLKRPPDVSYTLGRVIHGESV